jgi:SPP1 gp7 family putative phage head morphogenesis protein
MAGIELAPVSPTEAIEFFRSKGLAPPSARFDWRDVWLEEHARSFVVAKATQDDVLQLIRGRLDEALANGTTQAEFIRDMQKELTAAGWWGKSIQRDPQTGELKEVQLGSRHRLRTIFDTNMRTAHAAGRWARIQRTKAAFPYLEYRQIDRPTARDAHKPFDGIIRPVDDPIWLIIFPPNGWFCGCDVRQMNDRMLRREGKEVSPAVDLQSAPFTNPRTGETSDLPVGIDPGFSSNPGAAFLDIRDRHEASRLDLPASHVAFDRGLTSAVRAAGLRDRDETLVAYDLDAAPLDDSAIVGWSRSVPGRPNQVLPDPATLGAINDAERSIVAIHDHPSSRSFSGSDIQVMARNPGLAQIVAVGLDGSIYRAGRAGRSADLTPELVADLRAAMFRRLGRAVDSGQIAPVDANDIASHILMVALREAGFISYAAAPSGRMADLIERNRSVVAALATAFEGL